MAPEQYILLWCVSLQNTLSHNERTGNVGIYSIALFVNGGRRCASLASSIEVFLATKLFTRKLSCA